jgi:hypothetical protein
MDRLKSGINPVWVAILILALVIPMGCGDEDSPAAPQGGTTYTSPDGKWAVTATDSDIHISSSTVPPELEPYLETLIEAIVTGDGQSVWNVEKTTMVISVLEIYFTPFCEQTVLPYNSTTRNAAASLPIVLNNIDVTEYDLCETIPDAGEACVSTVSLDATLAGDLTWAADFKTFGGTLSVGSAGDIASVTIVVTGAGAGTYTVDFYGTWTLAGVRCSSCTPCP